jgi:uncharacterized protein YndB with AHSA1/START domain
MGTTTVRADADLPFIDIDRAFEAPAALLFRAYTEPDLLARWLGPKRMSMRVDRWELRDGGAWRYVNVDVDGTEYGFHGVFHGPPSIERLVQTFEFDGAPGHVSLDEVRFEERDGRTVVRTHSVFQSVADRDLMIASGMQRGVDEGYDKLDALLDRLGAGDAAVERQGSS